jgi:serine/threonine protein kinase/Flp pilus assembly protein TadD
VKADRWQQVNDLFQSATERAPEERAAFLHEACQDDNGLRREVESLIASYEQAENFIESPAFEAAPDLLLDDADALVGGNLGHYRIESVLGVGGMGVVYLAHDERLGRKVGLKLLPRSLVADEAQLERLKREARTASALNHPNIVTIHEIGEVDGTHYIATEFIDGTTLRQRIAKGPVPPNEALEIAVQIASALSVAHTAGVVHRDIKPENIMLRRDGYAKVLDFGIAKLTEQQPVSHKRDVGTTTVLQTQPGLVLGTARYMSPEQTRAQSADARTDIWSLGVVLYEMIGGISPFPGDTPSDCIASILKTEPPALSGVLPNVVPLTLQSIVQRALCKNREERYQKIKEMLADLRNVRSELEEGASLRTRADSIVGNLAARTRRKSHAWIYIVIVSALLSVGLFMLGCYGFGEKNSWSNEPPAKSIAVLPFDNATGNTDTEYLSDGIAEALINSLTELQQLKVIARSTAFRYKGKQIDPQRVGRELNVGTVLMGVVRQVGDRLNVQVDLVDATTGAQLWGQEYERKLADVLAVKQALVREVTEKLRLKLTGEQRQRLTQRDTTNPEAYQFYLRGRYYWNKRTAENLKKAMEQFQQAADKDPNYALAYVGLSDSYVLLENYAGTPANETLPKAKSFAERALQLDSSLAEVHTSLGYVYNNLWQWNEAEDEFKRAIKLNPNYPTAHHWYGMYLLDVGRMNEAKAEIKRAHELDPLSLIIGNALASVYLAEGNASFSIAQGKKVVDLDPNFPPGHEYLGLALLKDRRYAEAIAELEKAVELSGRTRWPLRDLGYGYAISGKRAEAQTVIKELIGKYEKGQAIGQDLAAVYGGLGDKDQAFAWLEKDFQTRSGLLAWTRWTPVFASLHTDPRFHDLVRRLGFQR